MAARGGVSVAGAIPLVGGGRLPLAFMAAGLLCHALIAAMFLLMPGVVMLPRAAPALLLFVHLWLPGFLLSVCLGATYQLMPVVLGEPLRGEKSAWWHLRLHGGGLALLLVAFWRNNFQLASIGGTLIAIGGLLFVLTTVQTFLASSRRDATAWSFVFAAGWLFVTLCAGVTLAHERFHPMLGMPALELLRAHAHLGLAGFFLTLLQGVAFQLMPMFMLAEERSPRLAGIGITGTQTGLLFLIPGLAGGDVLWIGSGVILISAGIACSGVVFVATFESRRKLKLEPGLQAFTLGMVFIPLAALVGIALFARPDEATGFFTAVTPEAGAAAYLCMIVVTVLGLIVPGMLCKILPFLVWMRVYGPRMGRQPVPPAHTLGSATCEYLWLFLHAAGAALLVSGVWRGASGVVHAGAWMLGAGALFFLVSMAHVARHLVRPECPQTVRPRIPFQFPKTQTHESHSNTRGQ